MNDALTVLFRVTDMHWASRAERARQMVLEHSPNVAVEIRSYPRGASRSQAYSTGYDALLGVPTEWALILDADVFVHGDVLELVRRAEERQALCGLRQSPLQADERDHWNQKAYQQVFRKSGQPYRALATHCAMLLHHDVRDDVLSRHEPWRSYVDRQKARISAHYHNAQAALALALAEAGVGQDLTDWWGPGQLCWPWETDADGRPLGIIRHGALAWYRQERRSKCSA